MKWVRLSSVVLVSVFTALLVALLLLSHELLQAHIDETILRFASDASVYYDYYVETYAGTNPLDNWTVFLRASPILLMILTHGNLLAIQLFNLALMLISLRVAFDCFKTFHGRMLFLLFCLFFPYFSFGFMSLNKEVYAMCAAIFYGSYMIRGRLWHLTFALLLALFARYYMVASLMMLAVVIPRTGRVRYLWILATLIGISLLAPITKTFIPEYSYENLLDGSGGTAILMAKVIDNFGYAPIYPLKYLLLLLVRPYGFLIGSTEDAIGAVVSIASLVMAVAGLYVLWIGRAKNPVISKLILAAFVAPIPIMWSEIMHWRYYSFVYFFLLYAVVVYLEGVWLARGPKMAGQLDTLPKVALSP
jgi:hypothetical protein